MASAQEALVASLRQVSTDIAHDLKTPIQRVAVIIEQITKMTQISDGQDALLNRAQDETERIVKTFDSLLQVAQIEGGAMRDRFVPTDLRAKVATIVDLFGADAEAKGFHFDFNVLGTEPFTVLGDRHLLGQVLANLIGNTLRHVPGGGLIRVALTREDGRVVVSICDDGPGIPAGERQHVLQRLCRLERSRHSEGNGLGLSLVAAVCDLHRASLTLDDNAPGLRVRIAFPLQLTNLL